MSADTPIVWAGVWGKFAERHQYVMPGIARNWCDGDSLHVVTSDRIATGYNQLLDLAEGSWVVLLHDDTELLDARSQIEAAVSNAADISGVCGGVSLSGIGWWTASLRLGKVRQKTGTITFDRPSGPVDAVDGLFMLLSPAATRLRFDEEYEGFHGYDVDFSTQARQAGLAVEVVDIPLVHQTEGGFGNRDQWDAADARWKTKWT